MTEIVLRTIHPVTVIGTEVFNILCLSAVTVAEDNAGSSFGNIASELSLTVVVYDSLCLS